MPDQSTFIQRRPAYTILLNGHFGSGKTLQALSFPKCYVISCDPAGLETIRQPRNKKFLDNLAWFEEMHNENETDLKKLFRENAKPTERDSVYGCLAHAREMAAAGDIETLVIDGLTYLCDAKWQAICEFEEIRSNNSGMRDTQAMYRNLGLSLQRFLASDLMTMSTRSGVNVILTCHLKRESEEQVQGAAKNRARKVLLQSDLAPMIEGSTRNKIEGLVGGSLYLEKTLKEGKLVYTAICDLTTAFGTVVPAKNRWGLPTRLQLNDQTLYEALTEAMRVKGAAPSMRSMTTATGATPTQPPAAATKA